VTKKTEVVQKLLKKIAPRAPLPKPLKEGTLLEQGMLVVLVRHLSQDKSESVLEKLRKAYPDWNEMRVAQSQEIAAQIMTGSRHALREDVLPMIPVARDAREWLQEVYQKTHGFDLEFLKEDAAAASKLVTQMPFLGLAGGSFLLWLASGRQLAIHGALVRVLDRLGLISRTASVKKARDVIEPLVPPGEDLPFTTGFGEVADRWCLPVKPICWECPLVEECPFGRKTLQEWKVSQARLEAQRQKEEARRQVLEKKDAARRAREQARLDKKAEAEAKKLAREREKQQKIDQKRREEEARLKARHEASQEKAAALAAATAKKAAAEAKAKARAEAQAKAAKKAAEKAAEKAKAAKKKSGSKPKARAKSSSKKR
jgi:endonuclease III